MAGTAYPQCSGSRRQRHRSRDEAIMRPMTPHASRLLQACEMIGDELAADPQALRDRRRLRALHAPEQTQDPEADVAELPVPCVEPVHLGLATCDVISSPTVCVVLVDEPLAGECVQMVLRRPHGQIQGSRNRPEMVARETDKMFIDPPTDRMFQSRHEGHPDHDGRCLNRKSRGDQRHRLENRIDYSHRSEQGVPVRARAYHAGTPRSGPSLSRRTYINSMSRSFLDMRGRRL